jgi:flavodoxin
MLQAKGFQITGEFSCKGLTTFGPAKLFGGVNKGRPNAQDVEEAQAFAKTLQE